MADIHKKIVGPVGLGVQVARLLVDTALRAVYLRVYIHMGDQAEHRNPQSADPRSVVHLYTFTFTCVYVDRDNSAQCSVWYFEFLHRALFTVQNTRSLQHTQCRLSIYACDI